MTPFAPFALASARFAGLLMFTPVLSSAMMPRRAKVLLSAAFTLALLPWWWGTVPTGLEVSALPAMLAGELLIGASMGLVVNLPFVACQLAGQIAGQQMGLGLAGVINPDSDIPGDNLGQLLFLLSIVILIAIGGLDILFLTVASSFERMPMGAFATSDAPIGLVVEALASGFELAVRLSLPVLGIIFLETIAVGFIMKTVPAINIMSFGFPIRIALGVMAFLFSLSYLHQALVPAIHGAVGSAVDWALSLGGIGGA